MLVVALRRCYLIFALRAFDTRCCHGVAIHVFFLRYALRLCRYAVVHCQERYILIAALMPHTRVPRYDSAMPQRA